MTGQRNGGAKGKEGTSLSDAVYLKAVLTLYLDLPDTPRRASSHDQAVARSLFAQGVPVDIVESALLLGSLRRCLRPHGALPLERIRSLAYFPAVIDELQTAAHACQLPGPSASQGPPDLPSGHSFPERLTAIARLAMKLSVSHQPSLPPSASPYRLLDGCGQEILWANAFLDAQRTRQLSPHSLRTYAFDLPHFARWSLAAPPHPLAELTQSVLQDYVRHQLDRSSPPCAGTINRRLIVVERLYRFHYGQPIPGGPYHFERCYTRRSALGYGRPRRVIARGLRLKEQRRLVQPLTAEQVAQFWSSFRIFRDLAIVGLMLLDGLRSGEILALQLSDFHPADAHLHVVGKGGRPRMLPLPHELVPVLEKYLLLERPDASCQSLFVCLNGRHRGLALTAAGLRSLFRHHRVRSRIRLANPHRFRHYADLGIAATPSPPRCFASASVFRRSCRCSVIKISA